MADGRERGRWWDAREVRAELERTARRVGRAQGLYALRFVPPPAGAPDTQLADLIRNGGPPGLGPLEVRMAPMVHRLVYRPGEENPRPAVGAFRELMDAALEIGTAEGVKVVLRGMRDGTPMLPRRSGSLVDALHAPRQPRGPADKRG